MNRQDGPIKQTSLSGLSGILQDLDAAFHVGQRARCDYTCSLRGLRNQLSRVRTADELNALADRVEHVTYLVTHAFFPIEKGRTPALLSCDALHSEKRKAIWALKRAAKAIRTRARQLERDRPIGCLNVAPKLPEHDARADLMEDLLARVADLESHLGLERRPQ